MSETTNDNDNDNKAPIISYRVLGDEPLSAGAYGKVYMVHDQVGERTLILKQMNKEHLKGQFLDDDDSKSADELARESIEHEVDILQYLASHCHLYTSCLVDFQEDEEYYYIFMDFDKDYFDLNLFLLAHAAQNHPLTDQQIKTIMTNLATGLSYLHEFKVVHRDIKPANLLIHPTTLKTKYIDFGFACLKGEKDCLNKRRGSLTYIAPEHIVLFDADIELNLSEMMSFEDYLNSDLWALGQIFYELLQTDKADEYERKPPEYEDIEEPADMVHFSKYLIDNKEDVDISPIKDSPFYPIIRGLLRTNPKKRWQLKQVLKELEALKGGIDTK